MGKRWPIRRKSFQLLDARPPMGKPSIINVEIDNESLSPFIAGYANMVAPSG